MDREIKKISTDELDDVAEIHMAALPNDILPNLGKQALINYYERVLADKSQYLFGVFSDKQVVAFCLVSIGEIRLVRLFCSINGLMNLLKLILLHPKLFFSGVEQAIRALPLDTNAAEISFLAVTPSLQGMGLGKLLLNYAVKICKHEKVASMQTKTSNQYLRDFYVREYCAIEVGSYTIRGKTYFLLKWSTNLVGL